MDSGSRKLEESGIVFLESQFCFRHVIKESRTLNRKLPVHGAAALQRRIHNDQRFI